MRLPRYVASSLRRASRLTALVCSLTLASAADSATSPSVVDDSLPVAIVDGTPITMRHLGTALLQKEGRDQLQQWLGQALGALDWASLPDDAPVITIGNRALTRRTLEIKLLQEKAAEAREDLIGLAVIGKALREAKIVINLDIVEAEWARMERALRSEHARSGRTPMSLADYIQATQGLSKNEFIRQPFFLTSAGVNVLVERRARLDLIDERLMPWFEGRRQFYDQPEVVDLSVITVPYQGIKDRDGKVQITDDERASKGVLIESQYQNIVSGNTTFEFAYRLLGQQSEGESPDGRLGWVTREGKRGKVGARIIPKAVMDAAWEAKPSASAAVLLRPIVHESGIDLVMVHGHRERISASFAEVRERVFQDRLALERKERSASLISELKRKAIIEYRSIPEALQQRELVPATAASLLR